MEKMNYNECIDFLFAQLPVFQRDGKSAYKNDLGTTLDLDKHFNSPHKSYKTIHVGGTNGKGSVSHMLCSVLMKAGYKVGLYTSPHMLSFRERIKINGEQIEESYVTDFVNNSNDIIKSLRPSFFELTVAMAFQYFKDKNIDIAIMEVGMGGRLDSTNIITPELSVITNISLDHVQFLGDSIEKIAHEKAGIIKNNIPVVIGEKQEESDKVFIDKSVKVGTDIMFASDYIELVKYDEDIRKTKYKIKSEIFDLKEIETDLKGEYQIKNITTALAAMKKLEQLGFQISEDDIFDSLKSVISKTGIYGRWQLLSETPLTICDTGHNKAGLAYIISQLEKTDYESLHFVFGMVNDKDIDSVLELLPRDANYYFTQASVPRALDVDLLYEKSIKIGLRGEKYKDLKQAIDNANKNAKSGDLIFIGGSTFVVADALHFYM
ncbi:MAG: bifunctional folylpolyglutamate synthase/dihydrofolate synthase [Marinifilaceae bacterium]|jgi:dihydrofolate synthase/folylpolyglutamate synthase|nr:bifunctional folylpolyglutamate synthase/dihydrofolate synthase [Marinifilaceae bacterium]